MQAWPSRAALAPHRRPLPPGGRARNEDAFRRLPEIICRGLAAASLAWLAACAHPAPLPRPWGEAERLFHADPRWLGGDAAISVDLGGGRLLWLFGDSFVDPVPPYTRREAAFPRNTVALQTGADPRIAAMEFVWRRDGAGVPASFFPEPGEDWYWPGAGLRLPDGTLAVFLHRIGLTAAAPPLNFAVEGFALALIANPDDPPAAWRGRIVPGPLLPLGAVPAAAVLAEDGAAIVLATAQQGGVHRGVLVRYSAADLAAGDLSRALWWAGEGRGWVAASALGAAGPAIVIDEAGAESSLHYDSCARLYVHVSSAGFGAAEIVTRTAPRPTGPWSAPLPLYRPPESDGPAPFVYAGKAHAGLAAPGARQLVLTYVASSFDGAALLTAEGERRLYWPRAALAAAPACAD